MRAFFVAALGLAAVQPSSAFATSFLYTFSGVVTYASNYDATYIYANEGDPIAFSLRVQDNLPTATYSYAPTGSSAIGGPDYASGTLLPVDRKVTVDPNLGYAGDFTPLESGFKPEDNYSASVVKDAGAKSLALAMYFEQDTPPYEGCQERCSGTRTTHSATANVFSDAFASPDYRELGTFDLKPGSAGTLADGFSTYLSFGDFYEVSLSKLTVTQLPDAVPEAGTWVMMIAGLGFAGAALRRRPSVRTTFAFA
jgi:hypothetical protein